MLTTATRRPPVVPFNRGDRERDPQARSNADAVAFQNMRKACP